MEERLRILYLHKKEVIKMGLLFILALEYLTRPPQRHQSEPPRMLREDMESPHYESESEKVLRKYREEREKIMGSLEGKIRPATVRDYQSWLRGFVARGGKPTHSYDYDWRPYNAYVATSDFKIPDVDRKYLSGASALEIIVPKGIHFNGGPLGHSTLFFEEGYKAVQESGGDSFWVPTYRNLRVNGSPRPIRINPQKRCLFRNHLRGDKNE